MSLERFSLKDKVILLTGGAGLYGRGLTTDLARSEATLIVASRNLQSCDTIAEEERKLGWSVFSESYDQGDEESIQRLCHKVMERYGRVDGVVNNSVLRPMKSPLGKVEEWEASMRVNATGLMLMHRLFGGVMCKQRSGSIVNISSIQGMVGPTLSLYPDTGKGVPSPDYFFHKGGMLNLARYYAALFGGDGVRVNCISPGGFFHQDTEPFVSRYSSNTFLNRLGNSDDLGGAVIFLLSDASQYVTGVNLPVDGGYTSH